jgi:D-tyrosyl-tRNA(Tyr) deacylase
MRLLVQRVNQASVHVDAEPVGSIRTGLLVFIGVSALDTAADADYLAHKVVHLRLFSDRQGRMHQSVQEVEGQILLVSQFTLLADCSKGNRPSFTKAASPEKAEELYTYFRAQVESMGLSVQTGVFGADMQVALENNGPVTLLLESTGR